MLCHSVNTRIENTKQHWGKSTYVFSTDLIHFILGEWVFSPGKSIFLAHANMSLALERVFLALARV